MIALLGTGEDAAIMQEEFCTELGLPKALEV